MRGFFLLLLGVVCAQDFVIKGSQSFWFYDTGTSEWCLIQCESPACAQQRMVSCNQSSNEVPTSQYGDNDATAQSDPTVIQPAPRVIENGLSEECSLDLLLVIDASGSVRDSFPAQLDLAVKLVDSLKVDRLGTRVAAVKYAGPDKARVVFSWDEHRTLEDIRKALLELHFTSGTTHAAEGLKLAVAEAKASDRSTIAVVLTDGYSQQDVQHDAARLRTVAKVYAAGVSNGNAINTVELRQIAGTDDRVYLDADMLIRELDRAAQNCEGRVVNVDEFVRNPGPQIVDTGKPHNATAERPHNSYEIEQPHGAYENTHESKVTTQLQELPAAPSAPPPRDDAVEYVNVYKPPPISPSLTRTPVIRHLLPPVHAVLPLLPPPPPQPILLPPLPRPQPILLGYRDLPNNRFLPW